MCISWWREPPPSSFVRWGERRTVSLRFHRGPATMLYSMSLLSCVLLDRLASQQSLNGSVKAQVRHTPATNSITSMVHPAAGIACKTKKAKFGPARDTSAKVFSRMDGLFPLFTHSRNSGWRHGYLSCHAKRGRRGDARVAFGRWTCYSHVKAGRSRVGRDRIRSQNISAPVNNVEADTWCSWETLRSHTSVLRQEEELWRPTPPL